MVQGQGGLTVVELLIAASISIVLLGMVVTALYRSSLDQQDVERRSEALNQGQIGLERMTRELRQATWVYFRSSAVVDLNVRVRPTPASNAVDRLVRWDCASNICKRLEGNAVTYPPPSVPTFASSEEVIGEEPTVDGAVNVGERQGQVIGKDVFAPTHVDPDTGAITPSFTRPDFVHIRLLIAVKNHEDGVVELNDGVSLRNATTFSG
jgi:type II secretory pathway pseudopilin PulG